MNYEDMSDFEINVRIAEMLGVYWNIGPDKSESGQWEYCKDADICNKNAGAFTVSLPDYCNIPSDAWPIMRDCLIGVSPDEDGVTCHFYGDWTAKAFCSQVCYTHKNPLRAAMIVFLVIQEAERG